MLREESKFRPWLGMIVQEVMLKGSEEMTIRENCEKVIEKAMCYLCVSYVLSRALEMGKTHRCL
jgi:hypothetical protein